MLSVLFVDDDAAPGGDGLSWGSAFDDLQGALERASTLRADGDAGNDVGEIWIAEGEYVPSVPLDGGASRSRTFDLVDGVTLYGGFSGDEAELDSRDWRGHKTTLSGNNAYGVVHCGEGVEAVIDGLRITRGIASSIYQVEEIQGGGVFNKGTLSVRNCAIFSNSAHHANGAGISNLGSLNLLNSTLWGNVNDDSGGAIYNRGTLCVTNSALSNNIAEDGGAIYNRGGLTIVNSTLAQNLAFFNGGGIYTDCSPLDFKLFNSVVASNRARSDSDIHAINRTLVGANNLIGEGAELTLIDEATFQPITHTHNTVGTSEEPVDPRLSDWTMLEDGLWGYHLLSGSPALDAGDNTRAFDHAGNPIFEDVSGEPRIENGIVDIGAFEGTATGTPGQTYVVTSLSNTRDAHDGELTFYEAWDAASQNQPVGDAPAGSFTEGDTIRFAQNVSGGATLSGDTFVIAGDLAIEGPGADQMIFHARGRIFVIQPGVTASLSGITIRGGNAKVGAGVCNGGTLTLADARLTDNEYGGAVCNAGHLTILRSSISDNRVSVFGGGGLHQIAGSTFVQDTVFERNSADKRGGAVYVAAGSIEIANCDFLENSTETKHRYGGAAVAVSSRAAAVINDSRFIDNASLSAGGGIYSNSERLVVEDSLFSGNSALDNGGAIHSAFGTTEIVDSVFLGNWSEYGGAVRLTSGTLRITQSAFSGNLATYGGAMLCGSCDYTGSMQISDSTIAGNYSSIDGGGICSRWNSFEGSLHNSIVAANVSQSGPADLWLEAGTISGAHNLIGNGAGQSILLDEEPSNLIGTTDAPLDPRFVRAPSDGGDGWGIDHFYGELCVNTGFENNDFGDLRLRSDSPAIDAGDNSLAVDPDGVPLEFDLHDNPRILDGDNDGTATVDMGALEYRFNPLLASLPDLAMSTGTAVYVNLDAMPVDDGHLTFTASTNNPTLVTHIPDDATNRSLRIKVESPENGIAGCMEFQLFEELAPLATARITTLAGDGFYDGVTFHRVIDRFMIQGGDPTGTGSGGSDMGEFDDQYDPLLMHTVPGVLSMANAGDDTNDSQFFITERPTRWLDFNHTVFGYLTYGEDIREAISKVPTDNDNRPEHDVTITSAEVFTDYEDGVLILRAPDGFTGEVDVTVTVRAENGGTATRTFTVNVEEDTDTYSDCDSPPYLDEIPTIETTVDTPVTVMLPAVDVDEGEFYFDAAVLPENENITFEIDHQTGELTVIPSGGIVGEHSILVGVRQEDASGWDAWDTQLVPIVIAPGQTIPLFTPIDLQPTPENTPLHFLAHADDPESPLTYALIGAPAGAEIDPTTGEFSWTPTEADGPGEFTFQVSATDTTDDTGFVEVTIQVTEVNEPPVLEPIGDIALLGGQTAGFTASASDADLPLQNVFFTLGDGAPAGATINPVTGLFSWETPYVEEDTTFTFDVVATDSADESDAQAVSITVLAVSGQTEFVVTSLADVVAEDGLVTLREALTAANTNLPVGDVRGGSEDVAETISFAPELFADGPGVLSLTGGALRILEDVLIEGPGSDQLTVDAHGGSRVVSLAADATAILSGLALTGGTASDGGAIHNAGDLTLEGVTLSGNTAQNGGAIYNHAGKLTLRNSILAGNAALNGAAICDYRGELVVVASTFSENTADRNGGAIHLEAAGTADLVGVVFTGNAAEENGGAIFNTQGDVALANVLMHANTAQYCGGAVYNSMGHLTVRQSTVVGNTADGCRFADSSGGGIHNGTGRLELFGSICALNNSDVDPDVSGFAASLVIEDSIVGDTHYHTVDGATTTTRVLPRWLFAGDPLATTDPLADLQLAENSPAVDAADAALLPKDTLDLDADANIDEPLPVDLTGAARILGEALDLGAFERPADPEPVLLPGDLTGDGVVNADDLDVVRANWGGDVAPGDLALGDASGDGKVNAEDLDVIRANWGAVAAADAVFGSLGEDRACDEPVYGPAPRGAVPSTSGVQIAPRWLEALAAEAWNREREGRGRS